MGDGGETGRPVLTRSVPGFHAVPFWERHQIHHFHATLSNENSCFKNYKTCRLRAALTCFLPLFDYVNEYVLDRFPSLQKLSRPQWDVGSPSGLLL